MKFEANFSFKYYHDTQMLVIFINAIKLIEVKINLINNSFKLVFETSNSTENNISKYYNHNDELIQYIVDELDKQKSTCNKVALKTYISQSGEFKKSLVEFLCQETQKFFNHKTKNELKSCILNDQNKLHNDLRHYWLNIINSNCCHGSQKTLNKSASTSSTTTYLAAHADSALLGKVFHELINSECAFSIFKQEYLFAIEYNLKYNQLFTTGAVNKELWLNRMESLRNKQQRLYFKFIFKLYEELKNSKNTTQNSSNNSFSISRSRSNTSLSIEDIDSLEDDLFNSEFSSNKAIEKQKSNVSFLNDDAFNSNSAALHSLDKSYTKIEESYTIQLGAQLKTTHNLRLIRCDVLDYCKNRFKFNLEQEQNNKKESLKMGENEILTDFIEPDSILTSMYLYSETKLSALVLLVDSCLTKESYSITPEDLSDADSFHLNDSITKRFSHICHRNGYDFHFQSIDKQIEGIQSKIEPSENFENARQKRFKIQLGDFYTTKHSNFSKTHVVYHLAAFDSEFQNSSNTNNKSSLKNSDLSSRHPVILGLRNILKSCFANNIQTLTFPLLLTHQVTDVKKTLRLRFKIKDKNSC
jgi:hypothetical protein